MPGGRVVGLAEVRRILREAWPLMLAEGVSSIVSLIDLAFVSRLGVTALAGVGVGSYAGWFLNVPLAAFYIGVLVLASQALGAGRRDLADRIVGESFSAAMLAALPLAATGIAAAYELGLWLSSGDAGVAEAAAAYLRARLLGHSFFAAMLVLDAAYRAAGANRGILYGAAATAIVNTVLDPILIYLAGLGVSGAGLATAASYAAGTLVLAVRARGQAGYGSIVGVPRGLAVRVFRVGAPAMAERLLFAGGNLVYLAAVARCGEAALAAHTIGIRIESLAFLPAFALSTYASGEVGRLVGAGALEDAQRRGWSIAGASAAFMTFMALVLAGVSVPASLLLAPSGDVAKLVVAYLLLAAVSEPALGAVMSIGGAIRGAGNTLVPTLVNLIGLYLVRVAPAYILVGRVASGITCPLVAWLIMDIDVAVRAAAFAIIYRRYFSRLARRLV
ncbi:MATE family efflux transporter [Pyrodictium delaneyi]|uniref:MATE family efflux transporter n=1 Tax=Pyrodictium delaneyi TaxID=1273541 RepID=UPI0015D8767C|nr:MATE family efflux transporter [Pyrodictium delaneyi]